VLAADDADALAARVLVEEHRLLVETLVNLTRAAAVEVGTA
jgi:folate-dependent phosphoribosylglycinamide formyltransferase PurN